MTIEELQQQGFTICKELFVKRAGNITRPIEIYQKGWFELQFPLVLMPKQIPVTIYTHIDFFDFSGKISMMAQLGFRCGYNKEKWKKNTVTGTTLFACDIDETYDKVNFKYRGTYDVKANNGFIALNGANFANTIEQFYADVFCNLNGSYTFMIESFN